MGSKCVSWNICICTIFCTVVLGACEYKSFFQSGTPRENMPESHTAQRIAEYNQKIEEYREELQAAVQAAGNIASFSKWLAIEYIKMGMFGLALESLKEALLIEPNNEVLFYLSGISAMYLAKIHDTHAPERIQLMRAAEYSFIRSIEIKSDYHDPLLGISVLYIFEQNRSDDALPYLNKALEIDSNNPYVQALLGRISSEKGENERAAQYYERAAELDRAQGFHHQFLENAKILRSLEFK